MDKVDSRYHNGTFGAQQLAQHVPFRGLPSDVLTHIYSLGQIMAVDSFSNIIVEGENSAGMYIIFEGMVGVYKSESSNRKGMLLKTLGVGQAFGEMSLLDRAPRSATIVAEVDTILFEFSAQAWDAIMAEHPTWGMQLYRNFAQDMAGRMRTLNEELIVSQRQLWRYTFSRGLKDQAVAADGQGSTAAS